MFSFFNLLDQNLKQKFLILVFLYFLAYAFELISISLIFPIIKILSDNTFPEIFYDILLFLNINDIVYKKNFFLLILGVFLAIFILRTVFLFFKEKYQLYFYLNFDLFLKKNLLNILYHNFDPLGKKNKSSETVTTFIDDVGNYTQHNSSLVEIITDTFITIMFASFLIALDYRIFFLSLIILGILSFIYIKITSKKFFSISRIRRIYYKKKLGELNTIFFGFTELKLAKKINNFFKSYLNSEKEYLKLNIHKAILNLIPKITFEIFLVLSISTMLLLSFLLDVDDQVALVATFSIISFRLFPKVASIIKNFQNLKVYYKSKKTIENILLKKDIKQDQKLEKIKKWDSIFFKNISYKYKKRKILNNAFLKLKYNQSHLITGDNGSGKSTLIKLLIGLLKNKHSRIYLNGKKRIPSIQELDIKIAYVPQKPYLFAASIYENVTFNKVYNHKDNLFKKISKLIGLSEIIKKNNLNYLSNIGEDGKLLSGGEGKKICLARALYLKPQLLILDEILDSLDVKSQLRLINYITKKSKNLTSILISHNQNLVKDFKNVYEVRNGKLLKLK